MQIIMFLTLGLFVFPSRILPIVGIGLLTSFVLIFVARPIGVFISLAFFKMNIREKLFISWIGLRGAVPIVFATYPVIAKLSKSDRIFHMVFFISVTSVLIQGTTLPVVAKWLRLIVPPKAKRKYALDLELTDEVKSEFVEIIVPESSNVIGKSIVQLGFPKSGFITLMVREGKYIQPGGSTILRAGDKLLVVADNKSSIEQINLALDI
jgi:cell volume regulation protein A